jgi:hypothetical protein
MDRLTDTRRSRCIACEAAEAEDGKEKEIV